MFYNKSKSIKRIFLIVYMGSKCKKVFNVNLTSMPKLNFENSLQKIQTELKMWQMRHLTPFGKVTVLKSLILAKFIHLFVSLPTPEDVI